MFLEECLSEIFASEFKNHTMLAVEEKTKICYRNKQNEEKQEDFFPHQDKYLTDCQLAFPYGFYIQFPNPICKQKCCFIVKSLKYSGLVKYKFNNKNPDH